MTDEQIDEQAVQVVFTLSDAQFGSSDEQHLIAEIEEELQQALVGDDTGSLDGDEFMDGQCTIFMYGPDAEQLSGSVLRVLRRYPLPAGTHLVKRFGAPGAAEVKLDLASNSSV